MTEFLNPVFQQWSSLLKEKIVQFLNLVNTHIIKTHNSFPKKILVSFRSIEEDQVEEWRQLIQLLGFVVTLAPLNEDRKVFQDKLDNNDILILLLNSEYATLVQEDEKRSGASLRKMILEFGSRKPDALFPLLCSGTFGMALTVVSSNFLIRNCCKGFLFPTATPTILGEEHVHKWLTFIDVLLHPSGSQGLGVIPDLIELEKVSSVEPLVKYQELFQNLSGEIEEAAVRQILKKDLKKKLQKNILRPFTLQKTEHIWHTVAGIVDEVLKNEQLKTGVVLCGKNVDSVLAGFILEKVLDEKPNVFVVSIDLESFDSQKTGQNYVWQELEERVKFKTQEIQRLQKQTQPKVILFKNYDQLGRAENLFVKTKLRSWGKSLKIFVTCRQSFFEHREIDSCFIEDPFNPSLGT